MIYSGFVIKSFEAGTGLWHARIHRADQAPVIIDGIAFPALEVGFAWSDPEAAIADAKSAIDRFSRRRGTTTPLVEISEVEISEPERSQSELSQPEALRRQ